MDLNARHADHESRLADLERLLAKPLQMMREEEAADKEAQDSVAE